MDEIPYLSYLETEELASRFLAQRHPRGTLPVPIEAIVEHRLRIGIVPVPGLVRKIGASGFLSNDGGAIYVDRDEMMLNETAYRFTLAHEVGHLVLHGHFYGRARVASPADFVTFRTSLSPAASDRLEIQASNFAGAVLLPAVPLEDAVGKLAQAARSGIGLGSADPAALRRSLIGRLSETFAASPGAVRWRLELAGLTPWRDGDAALEPFAPYAALLAN